MASRNWRRIAGGVLMAGLLAGPAWAAEIAPETPTVETMPDGSRDHWVAVGDLNPLSSPDTRVVFYDADKGKMLGMLSTGYWSSLAYFPKPSGDIVTLETYFEKGTRGPRHDYVVIYDPKTLKPVQEISVPPRRMTAFTQTRIADITDDGRFIVISNFTPSQSISIVDLVQHRFVEEVPTPGCGQVYPAGPRRFGLLCGDATLKMLTLDDNGNVVTKTEGKPFFDPFDDPVLVPAARTGENWLFVSMNGIVHDVDVSGEAAVQKETWSIVTDAEREDGWRTGGIQPLAVHQATNRLYVLMRKGGPETYEEPGDTVWVFDIKTHKKVMSFDLENATMAINVSRDDKPLLNAASLKTVIPYWSLALVSILGADFNELDVVKPALDIYDAGDGSHLRTIDHAANFATSIMQP
jgi:methylamine dehydrogenase heavy chain